MNLFLSLLLLAGADKTVAVRNTATPPRIDGVIEEIWQTGDSVTDFVQASPDEGLPPTERTVVYILQDRDNLYVAFRGYASKARPVAALWGMEEEATLFIDPMDSRNSGYFFKVYGSGLYRSGKILDDGSDQDWSWDAVWYRADRIFDDRWEVEMRIPFKSIRYRADAPQWGINFGRLIARNQETDYWTAVKELEGGNRVSNYGRLLGINPQARGYYFELYPEGFVRYDQDPATRGRVRPRASLNFKWDLTPQTTMNATVLPDFAQIESDPYSFNLSRYPTYFQEQRPFFIEGSEVFRMTGVGGDEEGIFSPLNIFYSRRIGKPVGTEPVPIISGLKLTTKAEDWHFGALGAYTDQISESSSIVEPRRGFAVLSGRKKLADMTDLGLLFGGTMARSDDYNYALGIDLDKAFGPVRAALQAALSDKDGKAGWVLNSGYAGFIGSWYSMGALEVVSDSFDVTDIGYLPWAGRKRLQVYAGPYLVGKGGTFRRFVHGPGLMIDQEPGAAEPSYYLSYHVGPQFRNNWGANLDVSAGRASELDLAYFGRSASLSVYGNGLTYNVNFGGSYNYNYNYRREFLAANYSDWFSVNYYLLTRFALALSGNNYWEADPAGKTVAVTSVLRPRIDFRINADMTFNVYDELVLNTPETRFDQSQLLSNRVGFLFSWNFLPKSWLYVALNNYSVDKGDGLSLANRVGAIKLRYLFYF